MFRNNRSKLPWLMASIWLLIGQTALAADNVPSGAAPEVGQNSFLEALTGGTPSLDLRYRYEDVQQNNFSHAAVANTVRTRLGYETGLWDDFKANVQVQNLMPVASEHYNDGTNGLTQYPTIADPRQTLQLYQGNLSWQGLPDTTLTIGRQAYILDDERWVGVSDWRQLGQTFDSLTVKNHSIPDLDLFYSYVFHVNRVYGPDARFGSGGTAPGEYDMHSNLFHASYTGIPGVKLIGYSYLLDNSNSSVNSTATTGGRFEGKHVLFDEVGGLFNAEYAHQESAFNNPAAYGFNYYLIEPGATVGPFTAKVGYDVMEGNGTNSLQTPLASFHGFNGWAERFLTTPASGLDTLYISTCYKTKDYNDWLGPTVVKFIWYDFNANSADLHDGNEYDAWLGQTFYQHFTLGLSYGDFRADQLSSLANTRKLVLQLQVKY